MKIQIYKMRCMDQACLSVFYESDLEDLGDVCPICNVAFSDIDDDPVILETNTRDVYVDHETGEVVVSGQ